MRKLAFILFFLICLCSAVVIAEDAENKTAFLDLSFNLDQTLNLDTKYTSLFKLEIKNKKPCSPKDTATIWYNLSKNSIIVKQDSFSKEMGCTTSASTGEFTPLEPGNYSLCGMVINSSVLFSSELSCMNFEVIDTSTQLCDFNLKFKTNETLFYEQGNPLEFKPELNNKSSPFVIEYWIEDLFGAVVKQKLNTTNTNEKSWKTNIEEQDRVLFLKGVVYPSCTDTDFSNNAVEKMFIVTKNNSEAASSSSQGEETIILNSSITIIKISPESASFGGILNAEMEIYKGNTDKYSVSAWIEMDGKIISEKTKAHLKNKNTQYKFTIPILLDSNCNQKMKDGDAQLIVEGLGIQEEKELAISGYNHDICEKTVSSSSEINKKKNHFEIIELPTEIYSGETFKVKVEAFDTEDTDFEIWGYLYRGSKCYSCALGERDQNKLSFSLEGDETKVIEMKIKADENTEGEYTLMVKYQEEGLKTEKSLSQKIVVKNSAEKTKTVNQSLSLLSKSENSQSPLISEKTPKQEIPEYEGIVVYESVSEKSKNLVSWFLFIAFGLLSLVLIWKRGNT